MAETQRKKLNNDYDLALKVFRKRASVIIRVLAIHDDRDKQLVPVNVFRYT